eukprot:1926661-Pyramimonas_sp.AAC.1
MTLGKFLSVRPRALSFTSLDRCGEALTLPDAVRQALIQMPPAIAGYRASWKCAHSIFAEREGAMADEQGSMLRRRTVRRQEAGG